MIFQADNVDTKPRKLTNKEKLKARKEKFDANKRLKNSSTATSSAATTSTPSYVTSGSSGACNAAAGVTRSHDRPVRYSEQNRTSSASTTSPSAPVAIDITSGTIRENATNPTPLSTELSPASQLPTKYRQSVINSNAQQLCDSQKPEAIAKPIPNMSPMKKDAEIEINKVIIDYLLLLLLSSFNHHIQMINITL